MPAINDLGVYTAKREAIFSKHIRKGRRGGCWHWVGHRDRDGYGRTAWQKRHVGAHRIAFMLWKGPIPEGKTLDHTCRVRHCVNPDHLEAVDLRENIYRGDTEAARNRAKTECKHGHSLSGDNLKVYARVINGRPQPMRVCLACKKMSRGRTRAAA